MTVRGQKVTWAAYGYLMLNKPMGTVSTTDGDERSVMNLIPREWKRHGMFPCGRLDVDTEGLLLITDDGDTAHALLSPRHHAEKDYRFRLEKPMSEEEAQVLEKGIPMDGKLTKPAVISLNPDRESGTIQLTEGKYHQVKRMMEYVGNRIVALRREQFGPLTLDESLAPGQCRPLSEEEIKSLLEYIKS